MGDAVFFVAGQQRSSIKFAGEARNKIGEELNLVQKDCFEFCWIVDFPMYEWNEEEKKIDFSHNPFSMPQGGLEALGTKDPLDILAFQYDIVCNGVELCRAPSATTGRHHAQGLAIAGYGRGGARGKIRRHVSRLPVMGADHGGIAPASRIVLLLCGEHNLREVVPFPMNQQAEDC